MAVPVIGLELGAALGIAILGTIQDVGYRLHLRAVTGVPDAVAGAARQSLATLAGAVDPADPAQAALYARAQHAFTDAMQITALLAAAVLLLAAVMAWRHVPAGDPDPAGPARER